MKSGGLRAVAGVDIANKAANSDYNICVSQLRGVMICAASVDPETLLKGHIHEGIPISCQHNGNEVSVNVRDINNKPAPCTTSWAHQSATRSGVLSSASVGAFGAQRLNQLQKVVFGELQVGVPSPFDSVTAIVHTCLIEVVPDFIPMR